MSGYPETPQRIVGLIKAIVNQDLRERYAAGFKRGSRGLARRIAERLGLKYHTVVMIKERRRHKRTHATVIQGLSRPREDLEEIRQQRILSGAIEASWKPDNPYLANRGTSYDKRTRRRRKLV